MDRSGDGRAVARGSWCVAGLRHAERDQTRLLLPDQHIAAVDGLLRPEKDRVLRVPDT